MSEAIATAPATPAATPPSAAPETAPTQGGFKRTGESVDVSTKKESVQAPPAPNGQPKATQQEVATAIAKFKVAMRGAEQEFDLTNADHAKRAQALIQKGAAADDKFREAAYMRKQAEDFIRLLKTDPVAVLSHPSIGIDAQKWAEDFLYKRIEESKMSPEQREAMENKKKIAEYEERERQSKEAQKRQEWEAAKEKYKGQLTEDIITVLQETNLPKSPRTVARMAHYILQAKQNGWEDVSPRDVVDMVREDYIQEHNELLGSLPQEELMKILNAEVRKRIREAELAQIKRPGTTPPNQMAETPPVANRFKKGLRRDEFRKLIDERTKGLE